MALKIRFRLQGRNNRPFYRLVVADSRSPRDGKYIEMLGWYNPFETGENMCSANAERIQHWLDLGAQISENALPIIRRVAPQTVAQLRQKQMKRHSKVVEQRKAYRARRKEKTTA